MPTCCTITTVPFVNQLTTTVPYSGDKPTVNVYYNISGTWTTAVATMITYGPASVTVDHGGLSTGLVKLMQ